MSQNNSNIHVAMCWEKKSIFECLIENRHLKQVVAWLFARRVKERNGFSVNGATLCFLLKLRVAFYRVGHWFDFAATCAGGGAWVDGFKYSNASLNNYINLIYLDRENVVWMEGTTLLKGRGIGAKRLGLLAPFTNCEMLTDLLIASSCRGKEKKL